MDTIRYGDGDGAVAGGRFRGGVGVGEGAKEGLVGCYVGGTSKAEGGGGCVWGVGGEKRRSQVTAKRDGLLKTGRFW